MSVYLSNHTLLDMSIDTRYIYICFSFIHLFIVIIFQIILYMNKKFRDSFLIIFHIYIYALSYLYYFI